MSTNCLSYWFPKIQAAGLPVPKTIMVPMSREQLRAVFSVFDGKPMGDEAEPFFIELTAAADAIGYPCFLRSGHTSAKHDWKNTCYLTSSENIKRHVVGIVEYGELACITGLPWDIWAVREFLPTTPITTAPRYGDMPITREFRYFVHDDQVICHHPYWPKEALTRGGVEGDIDKLYTELTDSDDDIPAFGELASRAGKAVGGEWSVDILETKNGPYITDMALADSSFHWEGCPNGTP